MPSGDQFVPLSKYIGQLVAVIAASILSSVGIWWSTGEIMSNVKPRSKKWKFLQREFGLASFTAKIRPLYMPIITLALSTIYPAYIFSQMNSVRYLASFSSVTV